MPGGERVAQVRQVTVDPAEPVTPLGRGAALLVTGVVERGLVGVDQRARGRLRRLDDDVETLVHGADRVERDSALAADREARPLELRLVDRRGRDAGGVDALEHRRVRLPLGRIDLRVPPQRVHDPVGAGDARGVADHAVRPGREPGAERRQARRGRGRKAGQQGRPVGERAEVRGDVGVLEQQVVTEPVDEDDDVACRFRQAQGVAPAGHPHGRGDARQDGGQAAAVVVGRGERRPGSRHHRGRLVAAESSREKARRRCTAAPPSAAALTRREKSSAVADPV